MVDLRHAAVAVFFHSRHPATTMAVAALSVDRPSLRQCWEKRRRSRRCQILDFEYNPSWPVPVVVAEAVDDVVRRRGPPPCLWFSICSVDDPDCAER